MSDSQQLDMFASLEPAERRPEVSVDPNRVRAKLEAALSELQGADILPWDARRAQYWRVVFPQMTNWLPAEEAETLRGLFDAEMRRLDAA